MSAAKGTGAQFVVDFGDAQLPEKHMQHINRSVQKAALGALADLDISRDVEIGVRLPPDLWGIIIRLPKDIFR